MKEILKHNWILSILLFILAAACLLTVVLNNNQSTMSLPLQQTFVGEYSRDGENWFRLEDDSELSALEGDLYLRGHFSYDIMEDGRLYYYQNHIGVTMYLNGELLMTDTISEFEEHGIALMPSMCGSQWQCFTSIGITAEDEVEIHLINPHCYGNSSAYRDFLNTLYNSPDTADILESYLDPYDGVFQIGGTVLIIMALMLLGAAVASGILRISVGGGLWKYGLLALFMGGFLILDTVGISFASELMVFNTYGRQLCMMLAVYCIGLCVCDLFSGKAYRVAETAMVVSAVLNCVLIAISFTGVMVIYDTEIYWAASQVILCPLLIACTAVELRHGNREKRIKLFFGILLLVAVLLDMAGVGTSIYSHGTCTKCVFAAVFVLYLTRAIKLIVIDHQASIRAKKLEKELEDSKIAITLSQIQPHFLYNTLVSISYLCHDAPEAKKALNDFSAYLRGNMDSLTNKGLIYFGQELRHVETYLRLEKLRFGDMLHVEYDIQENDFLLPPLTLQPLVENAVKHGLCQKRGGGTVLIQTQRVGDAVVITVKDDGVGFDPQHLPEDGHSHVGIRNVRSRLQQMTRGKLDVQSTPGVGTIATITLYPNDGK